MDSSLWPAFSQCEGFAILSAEILTRKQAHFTLVVFFFFFFLLSFSPLFHVIWNSAGWWEINLFGGDV